MLRVVLSLRFCLVFVLSLLLLSCAKKVPPLVIDSTAKTDSVVVANKCPASLTDLREKQVLGFFLSCDPDKDGTPFVDNDSMGTDNYSTWLLIDTQKMQLEVKRGDQTLAVFSNIALGRSGAGFKTRRGDNVTPLGEYKIGWINNQSQFHLFYGLTYPSTENANEALSKGFISSSEYDAIIYAHEHGQIPPQNTSLGGQVGIHGLGKAN